MTDGLANLEQKMQQPTPVVIIFLTPDGKLVSQTHLSPEHTLRALNDIRDSYLRQYARAQRDAELLDNNGGLVGANGQPILTPNILNGLGNN